MFTISGAVARPDILLDLSRLIWRASRGRLPTGIDRVCLAYAEHYAECAQAVVQWKAARRILPPKTSAELFTLLLTETRNLRIELAKLAARHFPYLIQPQSGNGRLYLNIGHSGLDQPALMEWVAKTDVRPIFMIHDLIPITHPEYCRPGSAKKHEKRVDTMLRSGAGIIGNSQATLDEIANYALHRGLPLPPMLNAWLGATPLSASDKKPPEAAKPFFVTLGTIEGRKNHLILLKLWRTLIAKHGPSTPSLVVIGQRGWENDAACALLDSDEALRGHVIELPRCTDTELAHYLRDARALLFPSFAEGYGMPLVEALGVGTPVIASNLAVFHELAGDIPEYLAPDDMMGWQSIIEQYSRPSSAERSAQLSRMTGYAMPTWNQHFAKVDNWLSRL
ncbi:glycosyltransferase family 4 protein [Sphingobium phenoxybenzoativorans]|uniref:glycosyltransferase family 4 protein n=1 Tax=Sphingobium phenoxybenzoativorans TaxID=1592790 RepID=UPI0008729FF9|nr:glycosyltransferase family 1 protein [Sphingobium phenoxybenzoativorans]